MALSVLALIPVFNEREKIAHVIERIPRDVVSDVLVVDDGSTDGSAEIARDLGATVLSLGRTMGVGAALRAGFHRAIDQNTDIVVVMAGNNKDAPEEIPDLLRPIIGGIADFVQGSRFLGGTEDFGDMPAYRKVATRVHPMIFSAVAGRRVSESTNGFRAIRVSALADPRLHLDQTWLDQYELEPYLYLRMIKLGYRTTEVPCTKRYPPKAVGQTKMKPIVGWWSMLRPLVRVALHTDRVGVQK